MHRDLRARLDVVEGVEDGRGEETLGPKKDMNKLALEHAVEVDLLQAADGEAVGEGTAQILVEAVQRPTKGKHQWLKAKNQEPDLQSRNQCPNRLRTTMQKSASSAPHLCSTRQSHHATIEPATYARSE